MRAPRHSSPSPSTRRSDTSGWLAFLFAPTQHTRKPSTSRTNHSHGLRHDVDKALENLPTAARPPGHHKKQRLRAPLRSSSTHLHAISSHSLIALYDLLPSEPRQRKQVQNGGGGAGQPQFCPGRGRGAFGGSRSESAAYALPPCCSLLSSFLPILPHSLVFNFTSLDPQALGGAGGV